MNKSLASFVFSGETLFCLPNEQSSVQADEAKVSAILGTEKVEEPIKTAPLRKKELKRRTLILVSSLENPEKEFLLKIMASVNIQETDIDIVTQAEFDYFNLTDLTQCREIISFGDFLQTINITFSSPLYQVQTQQNKKVLLADSLAVVSANSANEKRNLWGALKNMYGLS